MIRFISLFAIAATVGIASFGATSPTSPAPLVVHEWGTITTRHAVNGTPECRLNRVDYYEPLADFVHRYVPPPTSRNPLGSIRKVRFGSGLPLVIMRLETPVIYFHPAQGLPPPHHYYVSVSFRRVVRYEFSHVVTA